MKRLSIRILVALAVCAALAAFVSVPISVDASDHPVLPAVALEQVLLYRLEVALMVFYGGLLLITPAYSGLVGGRLPIEISARGARFAEDANQSAELTDRTIKELRQVTNALAEGLIAARLEIELLKEAIDDNTQPAVACK